MESAKTVLRKWKEVPRELLLWAKVKGKMCVCVYHDPGPVNKLCTIWVLAWLMWQGWYTSHAEFKIGRIDTE